MTIQLSVTVWTVICFIALMLILHNLLFKPVLKVMDARRERINAAKAKKESYEQRKSEYESMLIEKKEAFDAQEKRRVKEELEVIRADGKKQVQAARDALVRELDEYKAQASQEHTRILGTLSAHSAELAETFAGALIKE